MKWTRKFASSIFGRGGSENGSATGGGPTPVWVSLSVSESACDIQWKTLENIDQKPKASGSVPLRNVATVKVDSRRLQVFDSASEILLDVEADGTASAQSWQIALDEASDVFEAEIAESASASKGLLHNQRRKLELAQRKRDREDAKKRLGVGDVGLRFTAEAMARRAGK